MITIRHNEKIKINLLRMLLSVSGVLLCVGMMELGALGIKNVNYLVASIVTSFLFWFYSSKGLFVNRIDKLIVLITIFVTLSTGRMLSAKYGILNLYVIGGGLAAGVAIYRVGKLIKELMRQLLDGNFKFYVVASLATAFSVLVIYSLTDQLYQQYDIVYSMDSGWVFNNMYPDPRYYDIRHPLINIVYFPIYASCYFVLKSIGAYSELSISILIQIFHTQLFIISAMMLSDITQSKWTKWIYICSAPIILNLLFFEKFSIIVFLIILTVWLLKHNDKRSETSIAVATGTIMTSCVITGFILLDRTKKIRNRITESAICAVYSIAFFISFGRIHTIINGYSEATEMSTFLVSLPIKAKIYSYLNMIGASEFSIASQIENDKVGWVGLTSNINLGAVLMFVLGTIAAVTYYKKFETRVSILWLVFSAVLVLYKGWSIGESPLFAIYFSWAVVILTEQGISYFYKWVREDVVCTTWCALMAIINLGITLPIIFSMV